MSTALASSCLLASLITLQAPDAGLPPVEGDAALLATLRDANVMNSARYPKGELEAVVDFRQGDNPLVLSGSYRISIAWDGARYRKTILGSRTTDKSLVQTREKVDPDQQNYSSQVDRLEISDGNTTLILSQLHAQLDRSSAPSPIQYSSVRPNDWWYGKIDGKRRPWAEMLGPHPKFPHGRIEKYSVRKLDDDRVEVRRFDRAGGGFRAVADLALEGNVVEFTADSVNPNQTIKVTYTWERDPRGRLLLRDCVEVRTLESMKSESHYRLIRFDPDAKLPASLFAVDPQRLPPDTFVEDRIRDRNYRVGRNSREAMAQALEALADQARSRGFAAPDR